MDVHLHSLTKRSPVKLKAGDEICVEVVYDNCITPLANFTLPFNAQVGYVQLLSKKPTTDLSCHPSLSFGVADGKVIKQGMEISVSIFMKKNLLTFFYSLLSFMINGLFEIVPNHRLPHWSNSTLVYLSGTSVVDLSHDGYNVKTVSIVVLK